MSLVYELNALLRSLHFSTRDHDLLSSPTDLSPPLLLAILSALLPSLSLSLSSFQDDVQAMKMFLGVLETDVLGTTTHNQDGDGDEEQQREVSVCYVDPRRLTRGGKEECEYVGSVLVWLGRQLGLGVVHTQTDDEEQEEEEEGEEDGDILAGLDDERSFVSSSSSSRVIGERESSFDFFNSPSTTMTRPVRYDGYISFANEQRELEVFDNNNNNTVRRRVASLPVPALYDHEDEGNTTVTYTSDDGRPITPPTPSPNRTFQTSTQYELPRRSSSAVFLGDKPIRTPRARYHSSSELGLTGHHRSFDSIGDSAVRMDNDPIGAGQGSYARTLALLNRRASLLEEIARCERRTRTRLNT